MKIIDKIHIKIPQYSLVNVHSDKILRKELSKIMQIGYNRRHIPFATMNGSPSLTQDNNNCKIVAGCEGFKSKRFKGDKSGPPNCTVITSDQKLTSSLNFYYVAPEINKQFETIPLLRRTRNQQAA